MEAITRKSDIRTILVRVLDQYKINEEKNIVKYIVSNLLCYKIKFPLLEFIGEELYINIPKERHLEICDLIYAENTMGGLVIIGKMLQLRLEHDAETSIAKATHYISLADEWYICDIIGERVFGYGMCYHTELCFDSIQSIFSSNNRWVLRGMGAGCHFAIKRGLEERYVEQLFLELLKYGKSKDKEIRQGIGWACKTTAKFHPQLITKHRISIDNESMVDNWIRRKVKMGLERAEYIKQKRVK